MDLEAIEAMSDAEVREQAVTAAKNTVVGVNFWLEELQRREYEHLSGHPPGRSRPAAP